MAFHNHKQKKYVVNLDIENAFEWLCIWVMNTPLPEAGQPPLLRNFPIVTNLILVYSSLNGSSLMLLITLLH